MAELERNVLLLMLAMLEATTPEAEGWASRAET